MPFDIDALITALKKHLDAYEFPEAAAQVERTVTAIDQGIAVFNRKQRAAALKALRGARQFDAMAKLAQALMRSGHDDPGGSDFDPFVRKIYAQSLIENGQTSAAIDTLRTGNSLIAGLPEALFNDPYIDFERREMLGLLGRANKQIYMDAAAARAATAKADRPAAAPLQAAMQWYEAAAERQQPVVCHWPLINKIAVTARAEWDGVPTPFDRNAEQMARETIAALLPVASAATAAQPADPWMLASLGEAYVAIGDWPQAARWYAAYTDGAYVDAFQIASSIRQLVEVWRIDPEAPGGGGALVQMLRVRLADMPGGGIMLSDNGFALLNAIQSADGLTPQAILGKDWPMKLSSLQTGITRALSVAAVYEVGDDAAIGTAFLVRGGDLCKDWGDEVVAVTAAHVVSRGGAIQPRHARLRFEARSKTGRRQFVCDATSLFESPVDQLDACVLRVKDLPDDFDVAPVKDFDAIHGALDAFSPAERSCVIIGHPDGRELAISLANSQLVDVGYKSASRPGDIFLRYTTPTQGGNSGSPVYDRNWNLLGLHRAGIADNFRKTGIRPLSGRKAQNYLANEGVSLKTIAGEIASQKTGATVAVTMAAAIGTPDTVEKLAAAIADPNTTEASIHAWLAEPTVSSFLMVEPHTGAGEAMAPEGRRDVSELLKYTAAVALSKAFRQRRKGYYLSALQDRTKTQLKFVSEGDSWFQYPLPTLRDVIDHLSDTFPIHCRAIAGMEVGKISANAMDFFAAVQDHQPDGVLLSGGGNDLLGDGVVVKYVRHFDPNATAEQHLNERLDRTIDDLLGEFTSLIDGALAKRQNLKFFIHGYDRAFPKRGGKWLRGPLLEQRGIQTMKQQADIVSAIVDRFNVALEGFAARHSGVVYYVDCRGAVGDTTEWYDELHPRSAGFGRVAARFEKSIRTAFKDHAVFTGSLSRLNG
jgi:Trypsin-like peptidase domain